MKRRDILVSLSALGGGIVGYTTRTGQTPVQLSVTCDSTDDSGQVAQYGNAHYSGFHYGGQ